MTWENRQSPQTLCLFDVDGTITPSRRLITAEMLEILQELRKKCVVGFVGGSDLAKQIEQIGKDNMSVFDFMFAENGLTAFKNGQKFASESFINWIGEVKYQKLVNFILRYVAQLDIPVKRGTFVEFRNGMINVSPIGRNCSQTERDDFERFDMENQVRSKMVAALKEEFPDYGLTYSIGGQISFDVFPEGWDKTYCLRHLKSEKFETIHFFGDKTYQGGNDFEIFSHPSTIGHTVKSPDDTISILKELFF